MLLLSAQQIHQWDAYTIAKEPVASIDLMERAALVCTDWVIKSGILTPTLKIFCGKGNNGGDGLAIARLLIEKGHQVAVYILEFGAKGTEDFQVNLQKLHLISKQIHFIQSAEYIPELNAGELVIDALYGSGLNRPLTGLSALLVDHINASESLVLSIDVPSGMSIDKSSKGNPIIRANYTLSFEVLKYCFLQAENAPFTGEVLVLPINLDPGFLAETDSLLQLTEEQLVQDSLPERSAFAHKGHFGHILLIAGSAGKTGAAIMASGAALRSGCGLLTVNLPQASATALHSRYPEAMVEYRETGLMDTDKYSTIAIGPGLGTDAVAEQLLEQVLQEYAHPMVIDADALNILSVHRTWLHKIPAGSVLTPHPKEFDRLFGQHHNEFDRVDKALQLTREYPIIIVLKGHHTLIASDGRGWFNQTGNAGLAKGGSGDVLTGIMATLIAQQKTPLDAAIAAVYLHGLAADLALENQSMESLLASDVIERLGNAFHYIRG